MEEKIVGVCILIGTADCNAHCPNCAGTRHSKSAPRSDGELRADRMREVLDHCWDCGCRYVTFNGSGEPMMSPLTVTRSLEIIRDFRRLGKRFEQVNVYTNGLLIGQNIEFCETYLPLWESLGLTSIYVSTYSSDEDLNAGAFGVERYPDFPTLFGRIKEYGFRLRSSLVLKRGYTDTALKFEALCEKFFGLGVDNISAWPLKDENDFISDLAPSVQELGRIREFVNEDPAVLRRYPGRSLRLLLGDNSLPNTGGDRVTLLPDGSLSDAWCTRK